ncbi:hypothetical protein OG271_04080 [Micromonospora rifamycinica]|uniref:hypothetical protein n=1 Tax=Micromonospora rifamycinica TaxID=291594 RepID=UPI002E2C9443|nr:hypothetical protein [Micromonospora rifamycinica]
MSPHRRPVPIWYVLLAVVVSVLTVSGAGIWYTEHVARRQCAMYTAELAVYREVPPSTETGRRLAATKTDFVRRYC